MSIRRFLLLAGTGLIVGAVSIAWGRGQVWLCSDYAIEWTAVAAAIALLIYVAETIERRSRLLATRSVVINLLYTEIASLMIDVRRIQLEMSNDTTGVVDVLIAREPAFRKSLGDLIARLRTPVLDASIDKLHTLSRRDLSRVSAIVAHVSMLKKMFEEAESVAANNSDASQERAIELVGQCRRMAKTMMQDLDKTRRGFEEQLPTEEM